MSSKKRNERLETSSNVSETNKIQEKLEYEQAALNQLIEQRSTLQQRKNFNIRLSEVLKSKSEDISSRCVSFAEKYEPKRLRALNKLRILNGMLQRIQFGSTKYQDATYCEGDEMLVREQVKFEEILFVLLQETEETKLIGENELHENGMRFEGIDEYLNERRQMAEEYYKMLLMRRRREYEEKEKALEQDLSLKHRSESYSFLHIKNSLLNNLMEMQGIAYSRMHQFYLDTTKQMVRLIEALDKTLASTSNRINVKVHKTQELEEKCKQLVQPLQDMEQTRNAAKYQLKSYKRKLELFKLKELKQRIVDKKLERLQRQVRSTEIKYQILLYEHEKKVEYLKSSLKHQTLNHTVNEQEAKEIYKRSIDSILAISPELLSSINKCEFSKEFLICAEESLVWDMQSAQQFIEVLPYVSSNEGGGLVDGVEVGDTKIRGHEDIDPTVLTDKLSIDISSAVMQWLDNEGKIKDLQINFAKLNKEYEDQLSIWQQNLRRYHIRPEYPMIGGVIETPLVAS